MASKVRLTASCWPISALKPRKAMHNPSLNWLEHCFLGIWYASCHGVAKDKAEAVKWFRRAAGRNDASARYFLGGCYHKGEGVTKDVVEAVKWFRKAAEQNHAGAQFNLCAAYYN